MPVRNKNFPSNNNYIGEISSLNDKEVEVISKEVKADTTDCAKKAEENAFTKTNTFSMPIKIDEIDNSLGNAMVRYKSTESNTPIVIGSINKPIVFMGSQSRPTYADTGSDFVGNALALKSDVDNYNHGIFIIVVDFINKDDTEGISLFITCPQYYMVALKNKLMDMTSQSTWDNAVSAIKASWYSMESSGRMEMFITLLGEHLSEGFFELKATIYGNSYPLYSFTDYKMFYLYTLKPTSITNATPSGFEWYNVSDDICNLNTIAHLRIITD